MEYTYKVIIDPTTPTAYASDFLKVKEFHVLDPYTVEVTYDKPYAPALGSWGTSILPSHLLEGQDITKSPLKREPIGTGPYKFKEWKTGEKIVVDSYHDYFEHRPYIDRVMTRIIPDLATTFLELKAGRLDQMGLTPLQYTRQTDTKWFKENYRQVQIPDVQLHLSGVQSSGLAVQGQKGQAGTHHRDQPREYCQRDSLGIGSSHVHAVQA